MGVDMYIRNDLMFSQKTPDEVVLYLMETGKQPKSH